MYIVRWLLGNPIAATWVALTFGVVATLLFFSSGGGKKEGLLSPEAPATSSVEEINIIAIDSNDDNSPVSTIIVKEEALIIVSDEEVDEVDEVDEVKDDTNDKKEKLTSEKTTLTTLPSTMPAIESEVTEAPKPADTTSIESGTATTDLSQMTNDEMLLMAREAYWNNGLDEAAQIYNKLIDNEPEVLEYKGELGNVYWRQGYPKKAAELYSEIAIPMIESGRSDKVANMIGFIGLFYPERAAEIHKKMQSQK